jgi:hypothetical protein
MGEAPGIEIRLSQPESSGPADDVLFGKLV